MAVAACGGERAEPAPAAPEARRVTYGEDPSQFADLRVPDGDARGTVVLLHGGSWVAEIGLTELDPLAERLTALGLVTWNLEYRRVGNGGGVPATLLDVAAGVDRLRGPDLPAGIADRVVLLGHSAGGQLCVWAASRTDRTPGGRPKVRALGAISLAGVLDLASASTGEVAEAVTAFMGGPPAAVPDRYDVADPSRLVPPSCRVWAVHADRDDVVPEQQSLDYVAAAQAAGGTAEQVVVPADHVSINHPDSPSFGTIAELVTEALSSDP
jgi:acetyl esterase/lipase